MAERRMFSRTVIDSDIFIDMPLTAQALYFHFGMNADDDGFVSSPKKIQRMIGASTDDYEALVTREFIIPFESGIIVVRHWKVSNYIQKDRYKPTVYIEEKSTLYFDADGAYTNRPAPNSTPCISSSKRKKDTVKSHNVSNLYTKSSHRLGKDRLGKDRLNIYRGKNTKRFTPPTPEEVKKYCEERKNNVDAERFVDFYTAKNWLIGKNKMKDWKAAVRTWERNDGMSSEDNSVEDKQPYEHRGTPVVKIIDGEAVTVFEQSI